jgi:hypothetical protein
MSKVSKALPLLIRVTKEMLVNGTFPRTAKKAWRREKVVTEIGARAALHALSHPPLRGNVKKGISATRGQLVHICRAIDEEFKNHEQRNELIPTPYYTIIRISPDGIYCTSDPGDPNRDVMYQQNKAAAKGHIKTANAPRREGEMQLDVEENLIPFRRVIE